MRLPELLSRGARRIAIIAATTALGSLGFGAQALVLRSLSYEDGGYPSCRIAFDQQGTLYCAGAGGIGNWGSVFKLKRDGSGFAQLHVFGTDGTNGVSDGIEPTGVLVASDGRVYGTTRSGGFYGNGVIFQVNTDGTGFAVIKAFQTFEGAKPARQLLEGSDGYLYGTAEYGGTDNFGTLFRLRKDGTDFSVLYSFHLYPVGSPGILPRMELMEGTDGRLYGTCSQGGIDSGALWSINRDGSDMKVLHFFTSITNNTGYTPQSGVTQAPDGTLYGSTAYGGPLGYGTIYKINPDGTGHTVLRSFSFSTPEGLIPYGAKPLLASDGRLYVSLAYSVFPNAGSVFSMNLDGSDLVIEQTFGYQTAIGGPNVYGVQEGPDHFLYGGTWNGGSYGKGTIFLLKSLAGPDTMPPTIKIPHSNVVAEAFSPAGRGVAFNDVSAYDDVDGPVPVSFDPAAGTIFPIGTTTVTATAVDSSGNKATATFTVTIVDTIPPSIDALSASPAVLSPANHQMIPVTLSVTASDMVGVVSTKIVSVSSNEPDNGIGDGDTPNDVVITGPLSLNLRAERAGSGTGRVYTITVEARDAAGNAARKATTVTVPH